MSNILNIYMHLFGGLHF